MNNYRNVRNKAVEQTIITSVMQVLFFCYRQIYDIFNMSCLGVILQVSGHDGMCLYRRMVRLHTHSLMYTSRICQGVFPLRSLRFSDPLMSSYGRSP